MRLLECVPNFSDGRDPAVIARITDAIKAVEGVRLLNVDPGKATNRTVVTFVGEPEPVMEAAFQAIKLAGELIDMSQHHGEHPRMGATDVCPFVPISGVTMAEAAEYATALARRVGEELDLPVYLYEAAQPDPSRRNLAVIRSGEYEGLPDKVVALPPDFGPARFDARRGATVIGARDFLVAYNVNLNTTSTRRANAIAFDVREAGRTTTGPLGEPANTPGTLKAVKAIGWFIEEYGVAQVSMNLTDIGVTPVHVAFDEVVRAAGERGIRVTGSELVGLVPLACLTEAGRYFLAKQQRSTGVGERELVRIAVRSLGLDELAPFNPDERIIEYLLRDPTDTRLVDMTLAAFTAETASESAAPGGGSIAAALGALGAALGTMVANLSSHRRGWDARWEEFSAHAEAGQGHVATLLQLVDEDTRAFERVMACFGMPKGTAEEKAARTLAIRDATREATRVPFRVMEEALASMTLIRAMAEIGQETSASDAGVGALCARSAVMGAYLNVQINAAQLKDDEVAADLVARGAELQRQAQELEAEILALVERSVRNG
ncbi:MAG: glutamate formimidoyltransferase [Gemmatimonadetes bacterium]|nr:glutamate formimidoyltransferase [Gemmatimonadota bacterium]MCA9763032.1 glutamate formimidoyltransferase [Gemmatimonadota bacterium]MCB9504695.1 glutamate formimidoyltransferase [Gemmatimonadales bacterium]HPF61043.1 glutamate formimidoyltransferase [Gemmatimonadales bacterium]HRX17877.1 glutamate formimidoyltransferase [Gemmatimonadales bacterium]